MLEQLTLVQWLPFIAVMLIAGLVHGTLGMGFPMVATPILALFVDIRTAILITLLPTVAVNLFSIARGGHWSASIGRFWPLALYALVGGAIGAEVIAHYDPAPFKLLLASLVFLYLGSSWATALDMGFVNRYFTLSMFGFGLLAGFSAGSTNVMVPILIIYTLEFRLEKTAMVQVFNSCFLAGKVAQLAVFSVTGLLGLDEALSTLPLAVVALGALFCGMWLRDRIPTQTYRRLVKGLLFVLAVILVVQYFAFDVGAYTQ